MALLMKKLLPEVSKFISSIYLTPLSRLQLISKVSLFQNAASSSAVHGSHGRNVTVPAE